MVHSFVFYVNEFVQMIVVRKQSVHYYYLKKRITTIVKYKMVNFFSFLQNLLQIF